MLPNQPDYYGCEASTVQIFTIVCVIITQKQWAAYKRDNDDLRKICAWLNKHNPFDCNNLLRSLSSGLTATGKDNINSDNGESVVKNIHVGLGNVCVENAKIWRRIWH